ncbi:MAG: putative secreted protein [Frankiales bacterium]|nr:putative secreted protein [Frankiales bacterium]
MSKLKYRRLYAAAATIAVAAATTGTLLLASSPAGAAIPPGTGAGGGKLTPTSLATGTDLSAPTVLTSGGCGTDGADSFLMRLYGHGFSPDGFVILTPTDAGFSTTNPIPGSFGLIWKDAATQAGTVIQAGEYDLRLQCVDTLGTVFTDFTTSVVFSDATHYAFAGFAPPTSPPATSTHPTTTAPHTSAPATTKATTTKPHTTAPATTKVSTTAAHTSAAPTTNASTAAPHTTAANPSTAVDGVDASGNALSDSPALAPGDSVTLSVAGFAPGATVSATLRSTPQSLAPTTADASGAISYNFSVPSTLEAGSHTLTFTAGAVSRVFDFTVSGDPAGTGTDSGGQLSNTGAHVAVAGGIGVLCIVAGGVAVLAGRRRGLLHGRRS